VQDDARRFALAARMRAFGAKTLKEFVLMQREYSLKGLAEKIECPTLVCDNVAHAIVGGGAGEGALRGAAVSQGLRAVHRRGRSSCLLPRWAAGSQSPLSSGIPALGSLRQQLFDATVQIWS
jgi:hypothetical protein